MKLFVHFQSIIVALLSLTLIAAFISLAAHSFSVGRQVSDEWLFEHRVIDDAPHPIASGELDDIELVDIDGDGDRDIWVGAHKGRDDLYQMHWYQNPTWQRFDINPGNFFGATWGDIDSDGDMDLISGQEDTSKVLLWLENTGHPEQPNWPTHLISDALPNHPDVVFLADLNGDARQDIILLTFRRDVYYLPAPEDPKNGTWNISQLAHVEGAARTGGTMADIDLDGDQDIVWGNGWLENPGDPLQEWRDHPIDADWTQEAQSVVIDLDRDSRPDVILSGEEDDHGVAWYKAPPDPKTGIWEKHPIVSGGYHGVHSLAAADFDLDGDEDVFAAEMHQGSDPDKVTIFENRDIASNMWEEHIIGTTGSHKAKVADLTGDGYPDIVGKNWGSEQYPLRVDMWQNLRSRTLPTATAQEQPTLAPSPTPTLPPSPTITLTTTVALPQIQVPVTPTLQTAPAESNVGVPRIDPDYSLDVETWWASHPFNPEATNHVQDIPSPQPVLNVGTQFGGNIQAALNALPESGGTLYFPPGVYTIAQPLLIIGRSNLHFISDGGATLQGAGQEHLLEMMRCDRVSSYANPDCYANPVHNFYFRNLTFDGAGSSLSAILFRAARDIVFDNCVFQNFSDPRDHHRGLVSAAARVDNIWFRSCHFVGNERYALYLDGTHGSGVINSRIDYHFGSGGLLFLTNDDLTNDTNHNGTLDPPEIRLANYVVVAHNVFGEEGNTGIHTVIAATGANILIKENQVNGFANVLAQFESRCSQIIPGLRYEYYGSRVIGNRTNDMQVLVRFDGQHPEENCLGNSTSSIGNYQVQDNTIVDAPRFQTLVEEHGEIAGPNVVAGNCVNDPTCAANAGLGTLAPSTPITPTLEPIPAPPPTLNPTPALPPAPQAEPAITFPFPIGVFEDANMLGGNSETFQAMLNSLTTRGLDAVMLANASAERDAPLLNVSDAQGMHVFLMPAADLNSHWWKGDVPAESQIARQVAEPIVSQFSPHPSFKGYIVKDEPSLADLQKVALMTQAFRSLDPQRPATPILIGTNRVGPIFAAAEPPIMLLDVYPVGFHNPIGDFTLTGLGYRDLDFVDYLRLVTKDKPAQTPLWVILQTHSYGDGGPFSLRTPTAAEVRAQQWLALGEGATGLFWFVYSSQQGWTGLADNPILFDEIATLTQRISPWRDLFQRLRKIENSFTMNGADRPYVSTLASSDGKHMYVVAVNRDCEQPRTLSLHSALFPGSLQDLETSQPYAPGAPIEFPPGDGKIFQVVTNTAATSSTLTMLNPLFAGEE